MKQTDKYPAWLALILCASLSPFALAQSSAPPLKPNEKIVATKDGCGLVIDGSSPSAKYISEAYSKLTWGGPCVNGLAMGEGWIFEGDYRYIDFPPRRGWAWYGRITGMQVVRRSGSDAFIFTWDGRTVSYRTLSTNNPVWANRGELGSGKNTSVSDGVTLVYTSSKGCILEREKFPECKAENKFDIPGVTVLDRQTRKNVFHPCPNPRSPQGCEALWAQHAGPVIENIKAFIAENQPKVGALKREAAPLIAHWRPSPTAQRDDAARHAAIRAAHMAERQKREAERVERARESKRLDAQLAAQRAENERLRVISEQERKETRRRDRQEAMGVLRTYSNTAASMGNNKPANRLARVEELARNPAEGESRVSTALNNYADRQERKAGISNFSAPTGGPSGSNPYVQTSGTGSPGSSASYPSGANSGTRGLPIAECNRQADAWPQKAKLDALPKNDTPLMTRGALVGLDFLIRTYRQCLPHPQLQQQIDQWETQRAQTLKVCQQISTNPGNCEISPF